MAISRREFFKTSGRAGAGLLGSPSTREAKAQEFSLRYAKETTTICPYCAVGCGMIVHTLGGNLVNVEGDPTPINEDPLPERLLDPPAARQQGPGDEAMYRAPGAKEWKTVDWDWPS